MKLAGVFHCPHGPTDSVPHLAIECRCRKPASSLVIQAVSELKMANSILIGDKPADI
jgi:D-glycero-D-manno-heptose 1,7-bisphosphate phosphatase